VNSSASEKPRSDSRRQSFQTLVQALREEQRALLARDQARLVRATQQLRRAVSAASEVGMAPLSAPEQGLAWEAQSLSLANRMLLRALADTSQEFVGQVGTTHSNLMLSTVC
jgi:hypothetical protein